LYSTSTHVTVRELESDLSRYGLPPDRASRCPLSSRMHDFFRGGGRGAVAEDQPITCHPGGLSRPCHQYAGCRGVMHNWRRKDCISCPKPPIHLYLRFRRVATGMSERVHRMIAIRIKMPKQTGCSTISDGRYLIPEKGWTDSKARNIVSGVYRR
jgi:hypothetical protein